MSSNTRTRYVTAARRIGQQLTTSAAILDANAELAHCANAADTMRVCATEFRRLARIVLGDIGEGAEEWESEPLETPVEVPAEPVKVPA